jgi:predicted membrane protein
MRKKHASRFNKEDFANLSTACCLTIAILLVIASTGGISSFLFFLLYFLLFYLAVIFEPACVFVFTLALALLCIFASHMTTDGLLVNSSKLFTLLLLCPLSYFFGKEIQTHEAKSRQKQACGLAADQINLDAKQILQNSADRLEHEDLMNLQDILVQTESLSQEDLS